MLRKGKAGPKSGSDFIVAPIKKESFGLLNQYAMFHMAILRADLDQILIRIDFRTPTTMQFSAMNCAEDYRLKSCPFKLKTFFPK